ncbi:MAG TPA: hypothetical protein VJJ48_01645 [Candidatus Paceibacterota bacterium]
MFLQMWKKLGAIGTGFMTTMVVNDAFDYLMYPAMIGFLGPVKGGAIMTALALGLNYILVLVYNKTKTDWFGFEWLRLQEDKQSNSFAGKVLRTGRWPAFIFLSWEDPFKAFVFVRGRLPAGSRFTATDWKWFFGTNLIGNLVWILMVSGAIGAIKSLFF